LAEYELSMMRTDSGLFWDKGNQAVDPRNPDFNDGADPAGVRDARRSFELADEFAIMLGVPLILPPGTYAVGQNLAISSPVLYRGASFVTPPGVTVTFPTDTAPEELVTFAQQQGLAAANAATAANAAAAAADLAAGVATTAAGGANSAASAAGVQAAAAAGAASDAATAAAAALAAASAATSGAAAATGAAATANNAASAATGAAGAATSAAATATASASGANAAAGNASSAAGTATNAANHATSAAQNANAAAEMIYSAILTGGVVQDAANIITGNLAYARMPAGSGTWTANPTIAGALTVTGTSTLQNSVAIGANAFASTLNVNINAAAGQERNLQFLTAGVVRWILRTRGNAEGGANTGSDLQLLARDDAGNSIGVAIEITRANMDTTLNGNVGVGTAPIASQALRVRGAALTGSTQHGIESSTIFTSAATAWGRAVNARVFTAAAAFTMPNAAAFFADNVSVGAGSTVTTQYGLYVAALTSATTNWAVFTAGTTPSAFGGSISVGKTSAPLSTLDVSGTASGGGTIAARVTNLAAGSVGTPNWIALHFHGFSNTFFGELRAAERAASYLRGLMELRLPRQDGTVTNTIQSWDGGANDGTGRGTTIDGTVAIGGLVPSATSVLDLGSGTAGRALSWGGTSTNYVNIWAPASSSGLVLATGARGHASDGQVYLSSQGGGAWRRSVIRLNLTNDAGIQFFTDASQTITDGSTYVPTERMRITSAGRVLVGTASDGSAGVGGIRVVGESQFDAALNVTNATATLRLVAGTTGGENVGFVGTTGAHALVLRTNATEQMRLTSSGRLLVGTTLETGAAAGGIRVAGTSQFDAGVSVIGSFVVGSAVAAAGQTLILASTAGYLRDIAFQTGAAVRWTFRTTSEAETGSSAGSNFTIIGRNDAGTLLHETTINRATGAWTFPSDIVAAQVIRRSATDQNLVVAGGNASNNGGNAVFYGSANGTFGGSAILLRTDGTSRMLLNPSGNYGFGTTDVEAWAANYAAFQLGTRAALYFRTSGSDGVYLMDNAYTDGTWKYRTTDVASRVGVASGRVTLDVAPSGTIDTALTWSEALRVDYSGAARIGFFGVTPFARPSFAAATGTATRTTFATGTVTTTQLAERVKALIDDLRSYGLFA
jgi:trimeric autotransporter adhesin